MTMKTPDIFTPPTNTLKLGLCQVYTEPWEVEANYARTCEALREAALKGAELAITPECVFHGYGFDGVTDLKEALTAAAEPVDGPRVTGIRELAKEQNLDVVVGFAELAPGGEIHNTAAVISREGDILDLYRKVHCRDFESITGDGYFVPGDHFKAIERPYSAGHYKLGTMICFDREVVESVRCLRALGSELIACPLATDASSFKQPQDYVDNEVITRVRAAENEVFIAVVNHAGRFNGHTFVVGPGGEVICQLGSEPAVEVIDLPIAAVPERFHSFPWGWMGWGFRRPEIYSCLTD